MTTTNFRKKCRRSTASVNFVLRWRRASRPDLQSIAWVSLDREETYALIQLSAPDNVPMDQERSDLYFLVDRSG
jgi:hypothetical protein